MRMLFTKWLFIAKIRSIRMLGDMQAKAEAATEVEKQVADREISLYLSQNPQLDMKVELEEAKLEIVELHQKMADTSYELYSLRKEKEFLQDKVQESNAENDKWRSDYEQLRVQAQMSQYEY